MGSEEESAGRVEMSRIAARVKNEGLKDGSETYYDGIGPHNGTGINTGSGISHFRGHYCRHCCGLYIDSKQKSK